MHQNKRLSVVMPAYNEEEHVATAVNEFKALGIIDEILIIDNNSKDRTAELARQAGATVISESKQGLGYAVMRAFKEAKGDYVFLVEPDGTFSARDVWKFLAYADEFDLILGTRTSKELIWQGANMGFFLRAGNEVVAKFLEFLFSGCSLTDCGCTFRLIKRPALDRITERLSVGASHCNPEHVILAFLGNFKVIEIPVNYRPRIGVSKITGTWKGTFRTGMRMIFLILWYRLKTWFGWKPI